MQHVFDLAHHQKVSECESLRAVSPAEDAAVTPAPTAPTATPSLRPVSCGASETESNGSWVSGRGDAYPVSLAAGLSDKETDDEVVLVLPAVAVSSATAGVDAIGDDSRNGLTITLIQDRPGPNPSRDPNRGPNPDPNSDLTPGRALVGRVGHGTWRRT